MVCMVCVRAVRTLDGLHSTCQGSWELGHLTLDGLCGMC